MIAITFYQIIQILIVACLAGMAVLWALSWYRWFLMSGEEREAQLKQNIEDSREW